MRGSAALVTIVVSVAAAAAAETPAFSDRAAETGLDFLHFNGMTGELYFSEHVGGGAALLDYDRDGDLDVYVIQGNLLGPDKTMEDATLGTSYATPLTDRLYRNDLEILGDGTRRLRFVDVTERAGLGAEGYGVGVAAADYDNDGWVDVYVNNFGPNQMLRNNGDGTFSDTTAETGTGDREWSVSSAFLDYDNDGWLDLYVTNYVDYRIATNKQCSSSTGMIDYCGPQSYPPVPDRLYRNLGDGTFEDYTSRARLDVAAGPGLGVVTADFDANGRMDLYVANDQAPNLLWLNQGDGTFLEEAVLAGCAVNEEGRPEASMGVVAGDLNGDGSEDLFMTHLIRETNTLFLNDGEGLFMDASNASGLGMPSLKHTGFGTALLDYDLDGWLDLFIANGAVKRVEEQLAAGDPLPLRQTNQLFRGTGNGSFVDVTQTVPAIAGVSEVSRGVASGDLDNDGDPDMVLVNSAGPLRLYVNEAGDGRSWVGLELLRGAGAGVHALGAQASARRGATILHRRVRTDGSYASSNDPRLQLGLDTDAAAESVRVRWPDGVQAEWRQLRSGRYLQLRQGAGGAGR